MLYQLPNGKCIEISIEQYLRMTDEELNMYVAYGYGEEVNDPFALSVLKYGSASEKEEIFDEEFHKPTHIILAFTRAETCDQYYGNGNGGFCMYCH